MCESVNCGVVQTMKGGLTLANASVLSVFVLQFSSGAIYITFGKKHFADYDSGKLQKLCSTKDIFCRRIAESQGDNDFVLPHNRDYGLSSDVSDEFEWYQCQ